MSLLPGVYLQCVCFLFSKIKWKSSCSKDSSLLTGHHIKLQLFITQHLLYMLMFQKQSWWLILGPKGPELDTRMASQLCILSTHTTCNLVKILSQSQSVLRATIRRRNCFCQLAQWSRPTCCMRQTGCSICFLLGVVLMLHMSTVRHVTDMAQGTALCCEPGSNIRDAARN